MKQPLELTMFAQRKHEKCDVENELTINSLDHIEKADFQLNKKAEMLVYQHFYLLLIHFEQILYIILRSCP